MDPVNSIDTTFDVRSDSRGKDPDSYSATLRRYHQLLWSKRLPSGVHFLLDGRLRHKSDLGTFGLSSDAITHTYSGGAPKRVSAVVSEVPVDEVDAFYDLGCTVGAYLVFPGWMVEVEGKRRQTVNQRRGTDAKIKDRFDLTLECIRRHCLGIGSPLTDTLRWYGDFFALFQDFPGYVDYFLLNDLVDDDYQTVRFWKDFDDFTGDPLPAGGVAEYREYMARSMAFITARNDRIARYDRERLDDASAQA